MKAHVPKATSAIKALKPAMPIPAAAPGESDPVPVDTELDFAVAVAVAVAVRDVSRSSVRHTYGIIGAKTSKCASSVDV